MDVEFKRSSKTRGDYLYLVGENIQFDFIAISMPLKSICANIFRTIGSIEKCFWRKLSGFKGAHNLMQIVFCAWYRRVDTKGNFDFFK